jgi:hypothetical protein
MASVTSRQELADYCLRRLGHPVIEINVDDDQIEDRLDDAFQFYREYHFDAVEEVYLKTQVTASNLVLTTNTANLFKAGEIITGATSGTLTTVTGTALSGDVISVYKTTEDASFTVGETVTSSDGATGVITSFSKGSYDKKYFDIADSVLGVKNVLPFFDRTSGINLFDIRYQMLVQDLYNLMSVDMIHYTMIQTHLRLINDLLVGQKPFRFNRHMNRLYVDMDWERDAGLNDYLIVNCYRILDPSTYSDVYNDMFLKRYATALIKRQWGENLKKFSGVQLPGGVTLNGQQIYDEALEEIEKIEEEMQSRFELPPMFITG